MSDLILSIGPEEDEGFAIDPAAGGGFDPNVGFTNGTIEIIIPEPASLALLALGGLVVLRRR
jgi:hypothetical protein